jgi:molybdopterin synthase catalytic subunit
MSATYIKIQTEDFSLAQEVAKLEQDNFCDGAIVTFVGRVRNINNDQQVLGLMLEHYPAMTETALAEIVLKARQRWSIGRVTVIHRIGQLSLGEQIVLVGVTSQHRGDAYAANEFIMDYLKTQAPFWKKELTTHGAHWLAAKEQDQNKAELW